MITLWRVLTWSNSIVQHDFKKVTAKFAIDGAGKRHALRAEHQGWFETREQAVVWKVEYLIKQYVAARAEYIRTGNELADFKKQEAISD